jgi:hypothetical protein
MLVKPAAPKNADTEETCTTQPRWRINVADWALVSNIRWRPLTVNV